MRVGRAQPHFGPSRAFESTAVLARLEVVHLVIEGAKVDLGVGADERRLKLIPDRLTVRLPVCAGRSLFRLGTMRVDTRLLRVQCGRDVLQESRGESPSVNETDVPPDVPV